MNELAAPRAKEESVPTNSSNVEGILNSIRNRPEFDSDTPSQEQTGIKTSLYDLLDILRAERLDTKEKEDNSKNSRSELRKHTTLIETVRKLTFREKVSETAKAKVLEYVSSRLSEYGKQVLANPNNHTAQVNHRIFATFRNELYDSSNDEQITEEAIDLDGSETHEALPMLPKFTFIPQEAAKSLAEIKSNPSLDEMAKYFYAVAEDIQNQVAQVKKTQAWKSKYAIVNLAKNFYMRHKDEAEIDKKKIYVLKKPDGQIGAYFEINGTQVEGTQINTFTLNNDKNNPHDLESHVSDIERADAILKHAELATEGTTRLLNGDDCSQKEFFAMSLLANEHKRNLEETQPEGYEKAITIIDTLLKQR